MKTKMMKRAAAFAASVLMTAAMAVPASAADQVKTKMSGVKKAFCGVENIDIPKKIYLFNPDKEAVYAPNITYTYTLGTGDGGDKITGLNWNGSAAVADTATTVTVKDGVANAIKISGNTTTTDGTAKLEFGKTNEKFATEQAETKGSSNFEVQNLHVEKGTANFPGAGVYRYTLTESVNRADAGVVDGTEAADKAVEIRYLDVYVDANKNIYGYVLADQAAGYEYDSEAAEASKKINELDPDFYHTQNVKITKKITGSMANKDNQFPVDINLTESIDSAEFWGKADGTDFDDVTVSDYAAKIYGLSDNESVEYIGLPLNTKVTIDETNNTTDNYNATLEQTQPAKNPLIKAQEMEANQKLSTTTLGTVVNREIVLGNQEQQSYIVDLTNNLEAVSPTGLLFRIAPYALMMTAGGVLIAVYLRSKKRDDAESMI